MAYNKETRERRLKLSAEIQEKTIEEVKKEIRELNAWFRKEGIVGNAKRG